MCVFVRERERVCVCERECERERESVCVCVYTDTCGAVSRLPTGEREVEKENFQTQEKERRGKTLRKTCTHTRLL